MRKVFTLVFVLLALVTSLYGQNETPPAAVAAKKQWYESFSIRGYVQARYNGLFQTNPDLECEQCDKSWGGDDEFFLRRIRLVFYGQISKQVYFYIQPDFASSASENDLHFGQIRDAYFDIGLDSDNEFRLRIGQSKVPYGFENMQSSQNRLPLDRNDALNSALRNERDLGVFFYWAPKETRALFSLLSKEGLKPSGDYGVFGLGVYNGQTANKPELNGNKHYVARLSYPIVLGDQIIEPGIQAYTGEFVLHKFSKAIETPPLVAPGAEYIDRRVAASFILYPKPFGIQAEYNIGEGPEYNPLTNAIEVQDLHGGYATFSYYARVGQQLIIPFTRIQHYNGGKKHELDARSYRMRELEVGIEWQPSRSFELTSMYTFSRRRFEDAVDRDNFQAGSLLRLQAQINF